MKRLLGRLKSSWHYLALCLALLVILILNIHPGEYLMGFDNISPYFGIGPIWDKLHDTELHLLVPYSPLLLITPIFEFIKLYRIPEWFVNQLFIFSSLSIGVFGAAFLARSVWEMVSKRKSQYAFFIGGFLYLNSLITVWLLNQVGFYFLAAYASIPWIIYLIVTKNPEGEQVRRYLMYIFYGYIFILFIQSGNNIVAILTYTFSILLLSLGLLIIKDRKSMAIKNKRLFIALLPIGILLSLQLLLLIFNYRTINIFQPYIDHVNVLNENSLTTQISDDLLLGAEVKNSWVNSLTSNTNWIYVHDMDGEPLLEYADLYTQSIPAIFGIGLIFLFFGIFVYEIIQEGLKKKSELLLLWITFLLGGFLSSKYIHDLMPDIIAGPLRWNASKFWPISLISFLLIGALTLNKLPKKHYQVYGLAVVALSLLFVGPMYFTTTVAPQLVVTPPEEYRIFSQQNEENLRNAKWAYLPSPENTYYYQYKWGYFGSTFMPYTTAGSSIDNGILDYFYNVEFYQELDKKLLECDRVGEDQIYAYLRGNSIRYILFDKNIDQNSSIQAKCLERLLYKGYFSVQGTPKLTIYHVTNTL